MANMSYCRFENTYKDLLDCSANLENLNSESEKRYRAKLIELCEEIVYEGKQIIEKEDEDEEESQD